MLGLLGVNKHFDLLPPTVCLFLPSDFLLLDITPFLSPLHVYGTIYPWISYHLLTVSASI